MRHSNASALKSFIRTSLAAIFYLSGIAYLRASLIARKNALVRIVLIHHIKSPKRFEAMVRIFAKKYHPISYEDFCLKRFHPSKINILVTMDDGYESWYTEGLAILERYNVPAIFFTPSGFIGTAGNSDAVARFCKENLKLTFTTMPLTTEMVQACAKSDAITIGGHTRTHPFLSRIDRARVDDEILGDKNWLEGVTTTTVATFAYPFGDYDEYVKTAVVRAGYVHAMTTKSDFYHPDSDPFEIPRSNHGTVSPFMLDMWVWGAYDLSEGLFRALRTPSKKEKNQESSPVF